MLLSILRVHRNLTPGYHQYIALSPYAVEHHAGSRKSNPMVSPVYSPLFMLLSILRVHGNLTPGYHQYIALSPYAVDHHAGSRKSNPMVSPVYSPLFMLLNILRVHGNLTPGYHQYIALSPYAVEHHAGSQKSNSMVSPVYSSLSISPLMTIVWLHMALILWDTVTKGTAKVYPLITLLQVDIHSPRNCLFSYRDFYMLSFRTVGIKLDGNCCPYLLSPTVSAPRTRCIGAQVTRFAGPFESRPADPIRRDVFRQLADSSLHCLIIGLGSPYRHSRGHASPTGKRHRRECHGPIAPSSQGYKEKALVGTRLLDVPKGKELTNPKGEYYIYIFYL